MKKALLSLVLSFFLCTTLAEPFSIFAYSSDSFDSVNYQLVDYVTPNGSNVAVMLNYTPNYNTVLDGQFYGPYQANKYIFGSLKSSTNQYAVSMIDTKHWRIRYNNGNSYVNTSNNTYFENKIYRIYMTNSSVTFSASGESDVVATYTSSNGSSGSTLALFAQTDGSAFASYANQHRMYDLKIYENSILVHHYYPCYRKSDNVVGIYDGVSNVFLVGTGGSLSYGSAVSTNYTITTSVSPSGSGTVSGGGSYASGSSAVLTATAYSGYVFDHWNDDSTVNPRTVTVSSDQTYTAYFVEESSPTPSYSVSLSVSPLDSGTVTGGGSYVSGTTVTISASANSGYSFIKWSDDVTTNPRQIVVSDNVSLTAIFEEDSVDPDPPTPPSGWTDWTDEDDSEYLEAVSNIDLSKIYWSINFERVNDFVQIYQTQMKVNSGYNGSLNVSFIGSYYDNTITGLTACNSTSYNYSTSSSNQVDVLTIEPAIYGSFDAPTIGEDGTVFNFGISVNGGASSNVTTSTNGFSNTTEACRLIGMKTGDGSIDGTVLLAAGYQKKTITYNDGSASGHTATFYVPGNEEINLGADMSFLDDLLEGIYIQIVNNTKVISHDEFTIRFHGKDGYLFPEYGHVHADTFLGVLLSNFDFNQVHPFIGRIDNRFYLIPQDNSYSNFNEVFSYHISDNMYDKNYVDLYWQETRNPVWKFKTNSYESSLLNGTFRQNYSFYNDYGGYISSVAESYTINNDDLSIDSNLTAGAILKVGLASVNMYNFKSNAILNRFNQLGSMMYGWFNRIYQAIGNITGGNESNEIINNVVEDYDIDVELNFNGLLSDVFTKKQEIDLNDPEYVVPSVDHSAIHSLAEAMEKIYDEVYIDNGIGIVIFAPLILLVLRLIL